MPVNPTVVIGVGEAGCKIASDLYAELQEWHSDEDAFMRDFEFVGIDTRPEDLEEYTKQNFTAIHLENPQQDFERDRRMSGEFPYLTEALELEPAGGATRQRGVSRYYIERNYDALWDELDEIFEGFFERDRTSGSDDVESNPNVWIVNSFGGGTGSGAFPLIAGMIDLMTSPEVWIGGIGSIPRLERLARKPDPPASDPAYYINSYAALRELATLVGYEFTDGYDHDYRSADGGEFPIEIPVYADANNLVGEGLRFEEPFFDFYGLMAIPEDAQDIRELNLIAANTILYFSEASGLEDFGSALTDEGNDILYSIDSSGVMVPVERLDKYMRDRDRLEGAISERVDVHREVNRLRVNRDMATYITDLDVRHGPAEEPAINPTLYDPETGDELREYPGSIAGDGGEGEEVNIGVDLGRGWQRLRSIYETATQEADAHPLHRYREEHIDHSVNQLLDRTQRMPQDFELDGETVARYFFYQKLLARYREELTQHPFTDELDETWEEYRDSISQALDVNVERLDNAPAMEQWEEAVQPFYEEWISTLQQQEGGNFIDSITSSVFGGGNDGTTRKRKRVEGERDALRRKAEEYEELRQAVDIIEPRRDDLKTAITEDRGQIVTRLNDELIPEKERLDERVRQFRSSLDNHRAALSEFAPERFMSIPMTEFERLTGGVVDDAESIIELENRDVVTPRDIVDAVSGRIDYLEERIQDRPTFPVETNESWFFGGLASAANVPILRGEYDDQVPGTGIQQKLSADENDIVSLNHPFYIRMVGFFKNFRLENMSEFGTIHRMYDAGDQVSEQFGVEADNQTFVTSRFAYPELLANDPSVGSYFGLGGESPESEG